MIFLRSLIFCVVLFSTSHHVDATWHVSYRYDQGSDCTNSTQFFGATGVVSGYCRDFATDYREWQCDANPPRRLMFSRTAAQCGASPMSTTNLTLNTCSTMSSTQISRCTEDPLPFPGQEFVVQLSFTAAQSCTPNSIANAYQLEAYISDRCFHAGGGYYQRYRCQIGVPYSVGSSCTSPTCACTETPLCTIAYLLHPLHNFLSISHFRCILSHGVLGRCDVQCVIRIFLLYGTSSKSSLSDPC